MRMTNRIKLSEGLYKGDCLDLLKDVEDNSVDLICADLPYAQTKNSWDILISLDSLWVEFKRVLKEHGVVVMFAQGMFTAEVMYRNPKWWKYNLIWEKTQVTGYLNAKKMPLRAHEDMCVFYDKRATYNPQKTEGHERKVSSANSKRNSKVSTNYGASIATSYSSTERYPRSVWKFSKDTQKSKLHPTQKPVALLEEIIKTYSNENALVLDPCAGSMTTAIAALNTNRKFICIEKDEEHFKNGKERVESRIAELSELAKNTNILSNINIINNLSNDTQDKECSNKQPFILSGEKAEEFLGLDNSNYLKTIEKYAKHISTGQEDYIERKLDTDMDIKADIEADIETDIEKDNKNEVNTNKEIESEFKRVKRVEI